MKSIFLLISLLCSVSVFSQSDKIEYKGPKPLAKLITLSDDETTGWEKIRQTDRYYNFIFTIDKNNKLVSDILVISSQGIDSFPGLLRAVESTRNNWIDHTGRSLEVVLPIWYLYDDGSGRVGSRYLYNQFAISPKREMVVLDPQVVICYPTMR